MLSFTLFNRDLAFKHISIEITFCKPEGNNIYTHYIFPSSSFYVGIDVKSCISQRKRKPKVWRKSGHEKAGKRILQSKYQKKKKYRQGCKKPHRNTLKLRTSTFLLIRGYNITFFAGPDLFFTISIIHIMREKLPTWKEKRKKRKEFFS